MSATTRFQSNLTFNAEHFQSRDTPFMRFWAALNAEMTAIHLPELTFGPAKDIWERALMSAEAAGKRAAA